MEHSVDHNTASRGRVALLVLSGQPNCARESPQGFAAAQPVRPPYDLVLIIRQTTRPQFPPGQR